MSTTTTYSVSIRSPRTGRKVVAFQVDSLDHATKMAKALLASPTFASYYAVCKDWQGEELFKLWPEQYDPLPMAPLLPQASFAHQALPQHCPAPQQRPAYPQAQAHAFIGGQRVEVEVMSARPALPAWGGGR